MWSGFQALPAYFGGKRRLVHLIFALLAHALPRETWRQSVFLDPFLGGGSVSLLAKAQGFHVICNDVALRSAVVGRGLIANETRKLSPADLVRLLAPPAGAHKRLAEERYSPSVFPKPHARLLDRAIANLPELSEPARSLATVLVIKWALRVQPMSQLRGTDARAAFEGDLDRVSPKRLGHYLKAERLLAADAWLTLAAEVNQGVFPGKAEATQDDAFAFLSGHRGDIVYLDPPYAGTTSYEHEYAVLDHLLEGEARAVSLFSKSTELLGELLRASAHIPLFLISLDNTALSLEELTDVVRSQRRNVRALEVPYRHLASIASEEKNARSREYLVLAY
jgi:hypothetical protein